MRGAERAAGLETAFQAVGHLRGGALRTVKRVRLKAGGPFPDRCEHG